MMMKASCMCLYAWDRNLISFKSSLSISPCEKWISNDSYATFSHFSSFFFGTCLLCCVYMFVAIPLNWHHLIASTRLLSYLVLSCTSTSTDWLSRYCRLFFLLFIISLLPVSFFSHLCILSLCISLYPSVPPLPFCPPCSSCTQMYSLTQLTRWRRHMNLYVLMSSSSPFLSFILLLSALYVICSCLLIPFLLPLLSYCVMSCTFWLPVPLSPYFPATSVEFIRRRWIEMKFICTFHLSSFLLISACSSNNTISSTTNSSSISISSCF